MKIIKLTQGYETKVDDEDYEYLSQFKWHIHDAKYICKYARNNKLGKMHRVILKLSDISLEVDHINGDGLDNRKENLRVCSKKQNSRNRKKNSKQGDRKCTSKYKGVMWHKREGKWCVYVKRKWRGYFKDEVEAAKHYNKIAIEVFGEFAKINKFDKE